MAAQGGVVLPRPSVAYIRVGHASPPTLRPPQAQSGNRILGGGVRSAGAMSFGVGARSAPVGCFKPLGFPPSPGLVLFRPPLVPVAHWRRRDGEEEECRLSAVARWALAGRSCEASHAEGSEGARYEVERYTLATAEDTARQRDRAGGPRNGGRTQGRGRATGASVR